MIFSKSFGLNIEDYAGKLYSRLEYIEKDSGLWILDFNVFIEKIEINQFMCAIKNET